MDDNNILLDNLNQQARYDMIRKTFARNLLHYIAQSGKPLQRIADDTGISKSALSNYCSGYRYPRPMQLDVLAKYFHVSVGDLTEDGEQVPTWKKDLSRDAYKLASDYDQLSRESKALIRMVMDYELNRKHLP